MIDRSRLGVVSNCWQRQLGQGSSLEGLIDRAVREYGFRQIELRQGSLGACEDADRMPHPAALSALASRFPEVNFDLAVELQVFSKPLSRDDTRRRRFVEAAAALSGHLRVVDLTECPVEAAAMEWLNMAVENLVALTLDLPDGLVSIEHSFQPWELFWSVFDRARSRNEAVTKLCYDPANLWLTGEGQRAMQITQQLSVDALSMVHLKQRLEDSTQPSFAAGDVDWRSLIGTFCGNEYAGPFLFEIAPSDKVWRELESGVQYLDELLREKG
ncbi:hypothetical protein GC176_27990 [bacterium]|nr:hypothetical protein [bacterium]